MGKRPLGSVWVGMDLATQDLGLLYLGETHTLPPNRVTLEPQG